ncbi:MAG: AMP-binding protein [bacterium]|nr:AMP-binding protein [bacterium]
MELRKPTAKEIAAANLNQKEKNYWLNKLANRQGKSSFPSYHKKKSDRPMESISTCFTGNTFALIQKVSGGIPQKLQVLLTTAVTALMAKYTNSDDILIGSPIFKQEQDELLVNKILALRTRVKPDASFKELLLETMTTVKEALEHLNYPIGFLQEKLEADTQDDPFTLFDTAIVLEELQERSYLEDVDAFMNMVFSFRLKSDCLEMSIDYRPGVYEPGFIKSLGTHFENLLAAGLGNLDMLLESIEIFSADQMKQLLEGFNDTFRDYPTGKTIHGLFEEQVEKTPDYTAVEFEGKTLTYKELNGKANHLARLLQQNGVVIETVVGIMLEPSPDMMVGLMAILKAGGAYLPIDAGLPAQRVLYMLEDAGAQILLTSRKDAAHIPFTSLLNLTSEREMDIFRTLPRSHIAAFDDLPMADRTLIDPSKYKNKIGMASVADCISIQATRGCPYECVFCHKVWSKKHAFRSADKIFDEVQHYYKQGVRNFAVIDDCFNLSKKNSAEFFQKVIANKLDLQLFFPNGLRGDILTPDYIDLMVEAGTRGINLSLETASPRLQQLIKKYIDIDKFREVMDYIAGTHPNVVLEIATMHGFPTETEDEAKMTLDFIKSIKWLHFPYIHILKIFPNTEMEELALEHGVLKEDILASKDLAFHELPETLPFPKSFTRAYQSDFMNNYFMQKERLEQVLPIQLEVFNEIAVVEKYNAYLPAEINSVGDIVEFAGLEGLELPTGQKKHESIPNIFDREPVEPPPAPAGAKKILFLDLTMHFSSHSMLYNVAEQPIGQIFLLTYLKQQLGDKVDGRIYKSGTDFDAYEELKLLVENYQPDLVAIRSLTFYKEFFHETVSLLRQWGVTAPIFAGGPYATSDYDTILKDHAVDLVVFGEGEYTVLELVERMLENEFKVPAPSVLEGIRGIAYPTAAPEEPISRKIILTDLVGPDEQSPAALPPGSPITSGGNPITSDGNPITSDGSPITSEGNPITSAGNLNVPVTDKNLAYVMYTSGSTGKPKGVMVEHRQVQNCINWMQEKFDLKEKNAIIQRTNLSFDPSVWEIFWPLYLGGKVRVLTEMQRKDAQYLLDIMAEPGDAVMLYCPATLVGAMTYLLNSKREVPDLVLPLLIIGAEPISVETVKNFYSCYQGQIINTYGPTECAINNTYYDISPADMRSFVPIGKPVANNQIYILSQDLKVLPVNVAGEICIAGDSVVRGYVNNKQKTDEVFLDNPFGPGKLYKTGDIGRWLDDGNIEIMGRVDMQVKIRGHRIETGEIEATLGSHSAVEEVVVIARDNKEHLENIIHCKRCGIGSHLPNVRINEDGNCDVCESLGKFKKWMAPYFKDGEKLKEAILELNRGKDTPYDCLLLYSGGRGAGYALYQLVELGLRVLAVTYDNGYFSKKDIANIKMITDSLGVDHISLTHKNTDKILRESMKIAHTVCRGCFHTSASLGVEYAAKHNIPATVGATLSRGQIIENKLFMLNAMGVTDVAEMEEAIKKLALSAIDIDKVIFDLLGIDIVSDKSVY